MTDTPIFADDASTARRAVDAIRRLADASRGWDLASQTTDEVDIVRLAIIWGWYQRINRIAEVVAGAFESGYGSECSPLVQSASEHTTALLWLSDGGPDAVEAVLAAHRDHQRQLRLQMQADEWDHPALEYPAPALNDRRTPEQDQFDSLQAMYSMYELVYTSYRLESALAHPTYLSAILYAADRSDGVFEPLTEASQESFSAPLEAARCSLIGALVMQRESGAEPISVVIDECFDELGIRFGLPAKKSAPRDAPVGERELQQQLIATIAECRRAASDEGYLSRVLERGRVTASDAAQASKLRGRLQSVEGKLKSLRHDLFADAIDQ